MNEAVKSKWIKATNLGLKAHAFCEVNDADHDTRIIIDSCVYQAIIQHTSSTTRSTQMGYLGGVVYNDNILHVKHFVPASRNVATQVQSTPFPPAIPALSIDEAIVKFDHLNLRCLGWYKTIDPIYPLKPTVTDMCFMSAFQTTVSSICFGILINHTSSNGPSLYNPTVPPDSDTQYHKSNPVFNMYTFKTNSPEISPASPQLPASHGKNNTVFYYHPDLNVIEFKFDILVNHMPFMCPNVMRELQLASLELLDESRLLYTALSFDYPPQNVGTRNLLDSAFDNHLSNFFRYGVGQASADIDNEYNSLAVKTGILKHHLQELICLVAEKENIDLVKGNIIVNNNTTDKNEEGQVGDDKMEIDNDQSSGESSNSSPLGHHITTTEEKGELEAVLEKYYQETAIDSPVEITQDDFRHDVPSPVIKREPEGSVPTLSRDMVSTPSPTSPRAPSDSAYGNTDSVLSIAKLLEKGKRQPPLDIPLEITQLLNKEMMVDGQTESTRRSFSQCDRTSLAPSSSLQHRPIIFINEQAKSEHPDIGTTVVGTVRGNTIVKRGPGRKKKKNVEKADKPSAVVTVKQTE